MIDEETVCVLYDYDYVSVEGLHVAVKQGEELHLVDGTAGADWWRVHRRCRDDGSDDGDGGSEEFYVPANYVKRADRRRPALAVRSSSLRESNGAAAAASDLSRVPATLVSPPTPELGPKSPAPWHERTPSSEQQTEALYENLAVIQALIHASPRSSGTNSNGINPDLDQWELHTDEESGRIYYYNTETNETSWEPPSLLPSAESVAVGSCSLPDLTQLPSAPAVFTAKPADVGLRPPSVVVATRAAPPPPARKYNKNWTATFDESGSKILVHIPTGERWYQTVDSQSRMYYYKENSQESFWDLPDMLPPPQPSLAGEDLDSDWPAAAVVPPDAPAGSGAAEDGALGRGFTVPNTYEVDIEEKRGLLNRCKIMEAGKKIKKVWNESYIVTSGMKLIFYTDDKAAISTIAAPHGKPEAIISLERSAVQWTNQKTTKRNVLEVACRGSLFLLQHDDVGVMQQWFMVLSTKTAPRPTSSSMPATKIIDETAEPDKTTTETQGRQKAKSLKKFRASLSKNRKSNGELSTVKDRLKNLISKRPAIESLQQKGIIKESVFNSTLEHLCARESTTVPRFVEQCILAIEVKGLDLDGIYRINGNLARIQSLRFYVNQKDSWNLLGYDVHVLTGALKLFFRELPEPLIPFKSYDSLVSYVCNRSAGSHRDSAVKSLLSEMPAPNRDTLRCLFGHLLRVLQNSKKNRMQVHSLAIVFGPTLMWPTVQTAAVATRMACQNKVVEYLLENWERALA